MNATKRPQDVITVDVRTARGLITSGHRYLDVRTNEEFNKSHVDNALNVPFMFKTDEGLRACNKHGRGYSAWVDSGLSGDEPTEELKTFCKFRP
ncbi:unnamed protein product [Dovyalis caffra]|uniref:Rhodanese domain-containing protein n=1 Tax=Dovyalis caffra TaxID=77055 RepID=A0AAV1SDB3_9ROSI|nr:unnamed protein product [Dovyalis caffra]